MKIALGLAALSFVAWTIALVMLSTPLPPVLHVYGDVMGDEYILRVAAVDLERRRVSHFAGAVNGVEIVDEHASVPFSGELLVRGVAGERPVEVRFTPRPQTPSTRTRRDLRELVARGQKPGMLEVVPAYGAPGVNDVARYLVVDQREPLRWHLEEASPSALGHTLADGRVMKVERGVPGARIFVENDRFIASSDARAYYEVRVDGRVVDMGRRARVELPEDARASVAFFSGPFAHKGAQREVTTSRAIKDAACAKAEDAIGLCRTIMDAHWDGLFVSTPARAHRVDPGDRAQIEAARAHRLSRARFARVSFWVLAGLAIVVLFVRATRGGGVKGARDIAIGGFVLLAALSAIFGLDWALTLSAG